MLHITLDSTLRVSPFHPDSHPELTARLKADTTMDNPEYAEDNAEEIAAQIRDGYSIERVTVEYVRQADFGCQRRIPAQAGQRGLW